MARGMNQNDVEAGTRMFKYPSTPYLPWSPDMEKKRHKVKKRGVDGGQDVYLKNTDHLEGKEVVATVKMDGENATLYRDYYHARSLDGRHHPSRNWIKSFHAQVAYNIPKEWRICGENLYAAHSIAYTELPSYFLAFSVWNDKNETLSWDETKKFCEERGIQTVPEIYRGAFDEQKLKALWPMKSLFGEAEPEGYVVRNVEGFAFSDFMQNMAKFVRQDHVQTDEHWMHKEVTPNKVIR